jgi:hypothetical protein
MDGMWTDSRIERAIKQESENLAQVLALISQIDTFDHKQAKRICAAWQEGREGV